MCLTDQTVDGYRIPAGMTAVTNLWQFSMPNAYDRPEEFEPERFLRHPLGKKSPLVKTMAGSSRYRHLVPVDEHVRETNLRASDSHRNCDMVCCGGMMLCRRERWTAALRGAYSRGSLSYRARFVSDSYQEIR